MLSGALCLAPSSSITTYSNLSLLGKPQDCTSVTGHLIFGHHDCSTDCTLSTLSLLDNVVTINGSLTIQCCHSLMYLNAFPSLTSMIGPLKIYYNRELTSLSGFDQLQFIHGNLVVSQNSKLKRIEGFAALATITGYLAIEYNRALTNLAGLSQLSSIGGNELLSGHALSILYNTNLMNLAGLSSLQMITYGTVHIEGNIALCFAGYPIWELRSYPPRPGDSVSAADHGIDWRTILSGVEPWQFTWVDGEGFPTLCIRNNAPNGMCGEPLQISPNTASVDKPNSH